jgi:hypothetical protein
MVARTRGASASSWAGRCTAPEGTTCKYDVYTVTVSLFSCTMYHASVWFIESISLQLSWNTCRRVGIACTRTCYSLFATATQWPLARLVPCDPSARRRRPLPEDNGVDARGRRLMRGHTIGHTVIPHCHFLSYRVGNSRYEQ